MSGTLHAASAPPTLFEDPEALGYRPPSRYLSDEEYVSVVDGAIIVCADTVLINRDRRTFYLASRSVYPMKGPWVLGGRVRRGESEFDAMRRLLKADTGLEVNADRLDFLSMNRYLWRLRKQEPVDGGSDNLCYTFAFEPTPEELAAIQAGLSGSEYDTDLGLREFTYDQLVQADVHPVILKLYREVFQA